jgi:aspartate/methionine/tyrosine aminotransferase
MRDSLRMRNVQAPIIPVMAELIRSNPGTLPMGQGVVGYGPPQQVERSLADFWADSENHKYKSVDGLPGLLELIAAKLQSENGVRVGAESRVLVTAGGNMAFNAAVLAIADPGDEIVLLTPYYFNHEMAVRMASCVPVLVATDAEYQPDVASIEAAITERTRAVVTISPNNPSGAVYSETALRAINALCAKRGIYHISDEAYEYFTYNGAKHFSAGSIEKAAAHTISLYSLSKAYGFASWRVGYMVVPTHLLEAVRKIQDTIEICAPVISQYAAMGALKAGQGYCEQHMNEISSARAIVLQRLMQAPHLITVPPVDGAFYFLITVAAQMESLELATRLIREFKVAVIPGVAFGIEDRCALRISYGALSVKNAAEGIARVVRGIEELAL